METAGNILNDAAATDVTPWRNIEGDDQLITPIINNEEDAVRHHQRHRY